MANFRQLRRKSHAIPSRSRWNDETRIGKMHDGGLTLDHSRFTYTYCTSMDKVRCRRHATGSFRARRFFLWLRVDLIDRPGSIDHPFQMQIATEIGIQAVALIDAR